MVTISELLAKPHGRDALLHVLTAMNEHWPKLNNGVERTTEHWLLAGHCVRLLQNVAWLAKAIIYASRPHQADVGEQDDACAHVCVWHEYTIHPTTNRLVDQIIAWFDKAEDPVIHTMDSARIVLLALLQMDQNEHDADKVYALLGGVCTSG